MVGGFVSFMNALRMERIVVAFELSFCAVKSYYNKQRVGFFKFLLPWNVSCKIVGLMSLSRASLRSWPES